MSYTTLEVEIEHGRIVPKEPQKLPEKGSGLLTILTPHALQPPPPSLAAGEVATTPQPDFLARAKAIWGEQPPGKPLSAIVAEARGGES